MMHVDIILPFSIYLFCSLYGGILLTPVCKKLYVNIQYKYAIMRLIMSALQDDYDNMQYII